MGCLRRTKEAFYWPGIYEQITKFISRCSICNSYKPEQQKEPLVSYQIPTRQWQSISAHLFELNGTDILVTTDHYSNFFELDMLSSKTARGVIEKLKPCLARYGLLDCITTMNHSLTVTSFRNLQRSINLHTLKLCHDTRSPMARRRTVLKQQRTS